MAVSGADGIVRRRLTPKQPESLPLTATAGFKRLGFVLLAVIAAGTGVLVTAGYLISADAVRQQAMSEIRAVTGLNPILRGEATVSLFPSGSVSFADVVLGDAQQPALTAERLTARLRFFPLLIGRVEIADVSLERPTIAIELDANGQSNWSGLIEALARSQTAGASGWRRSPRCASITAPWWCATTPARSSRPCATWIFRWPGRRSPRASAPPGASSGTTSRWTPASRWPISRRRWPATAPA